MANCSLALDDRMTKQEIVDPVARKSPADQYRWLCDLSWELRRCASVAYMPGGEIGHARKLVGFSELQHLISSYQGHPEYADPWPIEQLIDTLLAIADCYDINPAFHRSATRLLGDLGAESRKAA